MLLQHPSVRVLPKTQGTKQGEAALEEDPSREEQQENWRDSLITLKWGTDLVE